VFQSRVHLSALAVALSLLALAPTPVAAGESEAAVLAEINFARTQPQTYARRLSQQASYGGWTGYADGGELEEAIDFLMRQPPLPPLSRNARLEAAAREHAAAQGPRGEEGHGRAGALGERLTRHGLFAGLSAENIAYGPGGARDVVAQLIVDAGVAGRGHRRNIFSRSYQAAGVACGGHRVYGGMCVIDFAGAVVAR
jgi:hypothetical protein